MLRARRMTLRSRSAICREVLEEPADLVLNIPLDLDEQSPADKKGFDRVTVWPDYQVMPFERFCRYQQQQFFLLRAEGVTSRNPAMICHFSSNSTLSISPRANRSAKISSAADDVARLVAPACEPPQHPDSVSLVIGPSPLLELPTARCFESMLRACSSLNQHCSIWL